MTSLLQRLVSPKVEERYNLDAYQGWIQNQIDLYGGLYGQPWVQTWGPAVQYQQVARSIEEYAGLFTSNGPIFSLMAFRMRVFSQVRWSYRQLRNGRGGDLFSLPALDVLNHNPWLNVQMIQDADISGNFYGVRDGNELRRLRPDWVQVTFDADPREYDATVLGILYHKGGIGVAKDEEVTAFPIDEVVRWSPIPDPLHPWRGMSWLTPVVREIAADSSATLHKLKFFENAATPNMVVKYDKDTSPENFDRFVEAFEQGKTGVRNAYKTLHVGGGADITVVGATLAQMDFKVTQGAGESRLASAAGVHPVVVGFSEGMQGSSLNAGNFGQARRSTADSTLHPLWVSAASALANVVPPAADAQLWYDARDIPFLREDARDDADIRQADSVTVMNLVREGFDPASVLDFMAAGGDFKRLKHSGFVSVQLWKPGDESPRKPDAGADSPSQPKGGSVPATATN